MMICLDVRDVVTSLDVTHEVIFGWKCMMWLTVPCVVFLLELHDVVM